MSSSAKIFIACVLTVLSLLVVGVHSLKDRPTDVDVNVDSSAVKGTGIEAMMTEAESRGLAVVYNTQGRMLPLIFNPLSQLVTAIQPFTVLKLGALYSAAIYLMALFFPSVFGVKGRSMGSPFEALDFDYDYIQKSVSTLTERTANYLQIPEPECRYRAVCEAATYVATKVPMLNEWAKKVSGAFFLNLANPYSKAWINGMMQIECAQTYTRCSDSPYRTILNKFVAKK